MRITNFYTELGYVILSVFPNDQGEITKTEEGYLYQTDFFRVEIIEFTEVKNWLKEISNIEINSSIGWIFKITKLVDEDDYLSFDCGFKISHREVTCTPDTGEHLLAIWVEDKKNVVSIGTEDGEMMKYRAEKNDWMPNRFKSELGIVKSGSNVNAKYEEKCFTRLLRNGLVTEIPKLKKGENFYFHYLVATNELKKSIDYPEQADISTNLAVDFSKRSLLEKLKIKD